jgi:hypothetical protein
MATGISFVTALKDQAGHIVAHAVRGDGDFVRWVEPFTTSTLFYGPTTYDGSAHGLTAPLAAVQRLDGFWAFIGRGPDGGIYYSYEYAAGVYYPWVPMGGQTYNNVEKYSGPYAALAGDGSITVAYLNSYSNNLYVNREVGGEYGTWTGFQVLDTTWGLSGYPRSPPIALLVDGAGRVVIHYDRRYRVQNVPGGAFDAAVTIPNGTQGSCSSIAAEAHGGKRTVYCRGAYPNGTCSGAISYATSDCPTCAFSAFKPLPGAPTAGPWTMLTALADPLADRGVLVAGFTSSDSTCAASGGQWWYYGLK